MLQFDCELNHQIEFSFKFFWLQSSSEIVGVWYSSYDADVFRSWAVYATNVFTSYWCALMNDWHKSAHTEIYAYMHKSLLMQTSTMHFNKRFCNLCQIEYANAMSVSHCKSWICQFSSFSTVLSLHSGTFSQQTYQGICVEKAQVSLIT